MNTESWPRGRCEFPVSRRAMCGKSGRWLVGNRIYCGEHVPLNASYYCSGCGHTHNTASRIGRTHRRLAGAVIASDQQQEA